MLFFIVINSLCCICLSAIQIHLMLFFISQDSWLHSYLNYSNTSHVILYPGIGTITAISSADSNTSHVILYLAIAKTFSSVEENSNTSHVILYRRRWLWKGYIRHYSNTSHVILYRITFHSITLLTPIQIHLMLFFIHISITICSAVLHSNTSHVILYPHAFSDASCQSEFKYISCYSLSRKRKTLLGNFLDIQIHLMLFFIPIPEWYMLGSRMNSNTSHVILYPSSWNLLRSRTSIQIHLMLFFILRKE